MGVWTAKDIDVLNEYLLLTAKPVVYLVNISESDMMRMKNKWLPKITEWVKAQGGGEAVIPFSGTYENNMVDMPEDEVKALIAKTKVCVGEGVREPSTQARTMPNQTPSHVHPCLPTRPSTHTHTPAHAHAHAQVPSMIPKIIATGFKAINLIYFFTAGPDEVKCWQMRKGTKAPQVCAVISFSGPHTRTRTRPADPSC
jgi:obg-like ATPase 1